MTGYRKLAIALIAAVAMSLWAAGSAWAMSSKAPSQISAGAVLGYNFDLEAPLIGIDARFQQPLMPSVDLLIEGQGNYYFLDSAEVFGATASSTLLQFDLTLGARLNLDLPVGPYLLVGPALIHARSSVTSGDSTLSSSSETQMGFNAILGTDIDLGAAVTPYAQMRATFLEGTALSMMLGVNYRF